MKSKVVETVKSVTLKEWIAITSVIGSVMFWGGTINQKVSMLDKFQSENKADHLRIISKVEAAEYRVGTLETDMAILKDKKNENRNSKRNR